MLQYYLTACQHRGLYLLIILLTCAVALFCSPPCHAQILDGAWYKGDLHAHSEYSDGDSPVSAVIRSAEDRGLDFFTVTDHDTSLRGNPVHWDDPGYHSSALVLLYGIEWTTPRGHANVWSVAPFSYAELGQQTAPETGLPQQQLPTARVRSFPSIILHRYLPVPGSILLLLKQAALKCGTPCTVSPAATAAQAIASGTDY